MHLIIAKDNLHFNYPPFLLGPRQTKNPRKNLHSAAAYLSTLWLIFCPTPRSPKAEKGKHPCTYISVCMYIYTQSRVVKVREDQSALFYVQCTQPHCLPLGSAPSLPSLAPRGRTQLLSPPCSLLSWAPSHLFLTILVLAGGLKKSFSSWPWPNERNRPLQLLLEEMDRMEAFPGGISDLCSLSFQQAQLLVTTQLRPGHASPCFAAASPEVLHRAGFVLLVVKGHLPTAPEGPHPALPSHQGSCCGWGGHVWWGEEARRFGRRMLSPCLPSAIYISVEVSRGERELAAWWGGRGSVYWRNWNKQPNQSIRSWFKQMCQREHSEQMMLIAQCSLKSKQRANAAQWSFRRAGNGEVRREQTTEEAACSPLERGNNESAAAWKYLATWQISVLAAAVAAFTDLFIRKNKSDDNFNCEIAGQSQ